jgi:hypothetical protein
MKAAAPSLALCAIAVRRRPDGRHKAPRPGTERQRRARSRLLPCVDPADVLARRWLQDEPAGCPATNCLRQGLRFDELQPLPTYPPRAPATEGAHTMFWRFPVQPIGPHEVPRHTWR